MDTYCRYDSKQDLGSVKELHVKKQDAKTFLRQIRLERREIKILENKIKEKRFELLPGAIRYDVDRVQSAPEDRISELVVELNEYEEHLKALSKAMYRKQTQAITAIASIPSSEQRQVLEVYYLSPENLTWDDVATELSYSRRAVLNYHGDALLWLNKHAVFR